jgi:hypothetical protein
MAANLRKQGFEPGIWTAPLMMSVHNPNFKYHPDWYAREEDGNIARYSMTYGDLAVLDVTHPQVEDHLRQLYTRLRQAGFTYFKCDFTQFALWPMRFHNPSCNHARIIRKTFELIRECIGQDSYLLACGAPYESVIGVADAYRIAGDIHRYWSQIRQNIRSFLCRWWMHGAVGNADPDFAIVRTDETTVGPRHETPYRIRPRMLDSAWKDGRTMTFQEAKVWLLAAYLTGGDIVLGDPIPHLNSTGIETLQRILEPLNTAAMPLNLFERDGMDKPILLAQCPDGRGILACLNLTDDEASFDLDSPLLERVRDASDFWTDQPRAVDRRVTLPPRSSQAWVLHFAS